MKKNLLPILLLVAAVGAFFLFRRSAAAAPADMTGDVAADKETDDNGQPVTSRGTDDEDHDPVNNTPDPAPPKTAPLSPAGSALDSRLAAVYDTDAEQSAFTKWLAKAGKSLQAAFASGASVDDLTAKDKARLYRYVEREEARQEKARKKAEAEAAKAAQREAQAAAQRAAQAARAAGVTTSTPGGNLTGPRPTP